jgi:NAD(P)-dependent dehydrogenase (short-subunit alcohol dehydrogenase family)
MSEISKDTRTAFITGAASGIGRATAVRFASEGWFIGAADLNKAGLDSLKAELGEDACSTWNLDVTDKRRFEAVIAEFGERTGGRLDLLYNNAGIGVAGFFEEIPFEETLRVVQINLIGVLNGIHTALPLLKQTPGSLCFSTSSSAATYGAPGLAVYAATKFAVKGLTEALAVELSRCDVRVADVLPGVIDTPILRESPRYVEGKLIETEGPTIAANAPSEGPWRMIPPSEVAESVWQAYQGKRMHSYVPPEIEDIDRAKAKDPDAMRDARIAMTPGPVPSQEPDPS